MAAGESDLDHGMAALLHVEGAAVIDQRPAPAPGDREIGERGSRVERGEGPRGERQRFGARRHLADEIVEHGELEGERLVGGAGDALLEIAERHGGEAHGARHGLAVDEGGVLQQLVGMGAGGLDVVAEHVVVADLQGRYSGVAAIAAFQLDDQPAAVVAQGAQLVEFRRIGRRDEAAVAGEQRQIGGERAGQAIDQLDVMAEIAAHARQPRRQRRQLRRPFEQRAQFRRFGQRIADGREIARAAAAEAEARERALEIGHAPQALAQGLAQALVGDEGGDHVLARGDVLRRGQRCRQPRRQQAGAGAGARAVDGGEQRALALAGQAAQQLEVAAGGGVDLHDRALGDAARGGEARQLAGLGQLDIVDQRAGGREFGAGEGAEAVERLHAVERLEPAAAVLAVEAGRGQRRQRRLPVAEQLEMLRLLQQAIGQQQFARLEAGECSREIGRLRRLHEEVAGGDIEPGEAEGAAGIGERCQVVVAGGIEQGLLGDRAGGDDADDLAPHDGFGAALAGLVGILHLLADGHLAAAADRLGEIAVERMGGHAAHRNVLAAMLAAPGERDVENGRGLQRILEEQLVEIAHAVEQQTIRMRPLGREILRHRRRGDGGRFGRARR